MTNIGGLTNPYGVIFKIKPDGTNYTKLFVFNNINGASPNGSLYYDGIYLYGMTQVGGINGKGVIFKIKTDGTGYTDLLDFTGATNGQLPYYGSLISDGAFLYGMTWQGGSSTNISCGSGCGTVFKYQYTTTGIEQNKDKNEQVRVYPNPSITILNVELKMQNEATQIQITDVLGQIMFTIPTPNPYKEEKITVDISNLQSGVYFIKTNQGTQKFIKQD